jgi:hypothetical protein
MLFLSACSDTPLRDHALPTPTVNPANVINRLDSPDFQIPYLGSSAGMWQASAVLNHAGPAGTFAASLADSASRLGLDLSTEQITAAVTEEEISGLIDALTEQLAVDYGERALARFEVEVHANAAAELLRSGPALAGEAEMPVLRHQAGIHMLDALAAATRLDVNRALIEEAQAVALPLLGRTDMADAPELIEAWAESVDNAYRNVPTPKPLPSETEQIGTDITVELPAGNRFRGELLHDQLGCSGCHITDAVAPQWRTFDGIENPGLSEVAASRWQEPNYTGTATNGVEYLIESTVLPDIYVVDGYDIALMSVNYGKQISKQDMADIVAFLMAIGQ